jgi:dCMP deaminase
MRINKINHYLNVAKTMAERSPCSRRKFGAILVKNDTIISTGYNGSPRGTFNCGEDVKCLKDVHNEEHYKSYEHCPAIHAEMNVVINAARSGISTIDSTLFLSGYENYSERPCILCRRFIIQAGVADCYYYDKEGKIVYEKVEEWQSMENEWMKNEERL